VLGDYSPGEEVDVVKDLAALDLTAPVLLTRRVLPTLRAKVHIICGTMPTDNGVVQDFLLGE
jgi:hypothetical protein